VLVGGGGALLVGGGGALLVGGGGVLLIDGRLVVDGRVMVTDERLDGETDDVLGVCSIRVVVGREVVGRSVAAVVVDRPGVVGVDVRVSDAPAVDGAVVVDAMPDVVSEVSAVEVVVPALAGAVDGDAGPVDVQAAGTAVSSTRNPVTTARPGLVTPRCRCRPEPRQTRPRTAAVFRVPPTPGMNCGVCICCSPIPEEDC
jgi:hypothetical protein